MTVDDLWLKMKQQTGKRANGQTGKRANGQTAGLSLWFQETFWCPFWYISLSHSHLDLRAYVAMKT